MATISFLQAQAALRRADREANRFATTETRATAEFALIGLLPDWPIDTGVSLSEWRIDNTRDGAEIANDIRYVPFVHDGLADRLIQRELAKQDQPWTDRMERHITPILEGR